ncbi:hypothetical protein HHK36_016075 [Tetracentron sinense]|uniref:Amino acid transporter transmembrane domain-containing protein n=1 Tax=Tetracentron sinense TaxID=13715 RepID=A0A835DB62_TETSI|nr:hypothetical protein HHK36_016075 [Tetracentron sinense]
MKPVRKESGILIPLLPELQSPKVKNSNSASVTGAVFNVSTSIIGAGIMSIPATLKVLGVAPALALIFIIAYLVDVSVEFLLRFTYSGESTTYAGVMAESFGRFGSLAVQICVMVTNLGSLTIYLIIIGDVLSGSHSDGSVHLGVLQEWFGVHWWNSRAFSLLFVLLFVMLPLLLLRRVESLRFTSAVSVFLAVVFVGISTVMAIVALWQGKTKSPRLLPDLAGQASFFELFTAVPVIVTAFTFHFNVWEEKIRWPIDPTNRLSISDALAVHPIGAELRNSSDMISAVRISLVLCSAIYFAIGLFGYLLFGDEIMADILVNFNDKSDSAIGSLLNDTVRLSYALHLMLVFPLLNFSLRLNMDELLFPKCHCLAADTTRFVLLTCTLLGFIYIAAIVIPNIWYFFQFMGSTTAICLAFIFPGAIVLRDIHGISTQRDRILAALMIILAFVASSIAISTNV